MFAHFLEIVRTARHIVGGELPSLQVVYKESPEDYQRLQPPVPQTALCCRQGDVSAGYPSGYQANEQSEITHPTSHSHSHNMPCTAL